MDVYMSNEGEEDGDGRTDDVDDDGRNKGDIHEEVCRLQQNRSNL